MFKYFFFQVMDIRADRRSSFLKFPPFLLKYHSDGFGADVPVRRTSTLHAMSQHQKAQLGPAEAQDLAVSNSGIKQLRYKHSNPDLASY